MSFIFKPFKLVSNNPKKSIACCALGYKGYSFLLKKYEDDELRKYYCGLAQKFGTESAHGLNRLRKVTVFLNPAAQKGSGRKEFEKNAAHILHLAGIEVSVVKTEYEGQAKKYMEVVEDTDAIIVAGGDGTLSEVVTGLLRRDEEMMRRVPVGVIPLGFTNSFARWLFSSHDDVRVQLEAAYAIVTGLPRKVDVMSITDMEEDKTVYAVHGIQWGGVLEADITKRWFRNCRQFYRLMKEKLRGAPACVRGSVTYAQPCEGCSKCHVPPPLPPWKWYHYLMPVLYRKPDPPAIDYSTINNDSCGMTSQHEFDGREFSASINESASNPQFISVRTNPRSSFQTIPGKVAEYVLDLMGFRWSGSEITDEGETEVKTHEFWLTPGKPGEEALVYHIDSEEFDIKPVHVKLLRDKLLVFHGQAEPS